MRVGTCLAPVSWFSGAPMDREVSLGTAWKSESQWNTDQAGSLHSGWAHWSHHVLGYPRV